MSFVQSAARGCLITAFKMKSQHKLCNKHLLSGLSYPGMSKCMVPVRCSSDDVPRENVPLSKFPVPERSSLAGDIQERINTVEEKSGFLPNVFSVLSYSPDQFRCFFNNYDVLMETERPGGLSKAEKEMIVVVTSAVNNCHYCVVAHSAMHRIFSKDRYKADQLAINWKSADLTAREKAIVEFALDICNCQYVTQEHFDKLEAAGLSKEDAWEIGTITAFFAMSNRLAFLSGMRPNEEFYTIGRIPKKKSNL